MDKTSFTVGHARVTENDILLAHTSISRQHAVILHKRDGTIFVMDLGSTHGTHVDGRRLAPMKPHPLVETSLLSFGASSRCYRIVTEAPPSSQKPAVSADMTQPASPAIQDPSSAPRTPVVVTTTQVRKRRRIQTAQEQQEEEEEDEEGEPGTAKGLWEDGGEEVRTDMTEGATEDGEKKEGEGPAAPRHEIGNGDLNDNSSLNFKAGIMTAAPAKSNPISSLKRVKKQGMGVSFDLGATTVVQIYADGSSTSSSGAPGAGRFENIADEKLELVVSKEEAELRRRKARLAAFKSQSGASRLSMLRQQGGQQSLAAPLPVFLPAPGSHTPTNSSQTNSPASSPVLSSVSPKLSPAAPSSPFRRPSTPKLSAAVPGRNSGTNKRLSLSLSPSAASEEEAANSSPMAMATSPISLYDDVDLGGSAGGTSKTKQHSDTDDTPDPIELPKSKPGGTARPMSIEADENDMFA
eukprot:gb/GEZN01007180.1/.p1 GENE.gb/GEZN01007180.1/~~gb/GEZN01007180.1/.p1  ORF type:complete len:515 (+),score=91.92 gb/GEZN01007180.1/:148-1545(+)